MTNEGKKPSPYICIDEENLTFSYLNRKNLKWKIDIGYKKIKRVLFSFITDTLKEVIKNMKDINENSAFVRRLIYEMKKNKFGIILNVLSFIAPKLLLMI